METTTRAIWKCFYIDIFFETVDILDFSEMAAILIFYEMAAILKKSRWPHFDFKLNGFWEVHAQFRNVSIDIFF